MYRLLGLHYLLELGALGGAAGVVEFGAADGVALHDLELGDGGGENREDALYAYSERDLAHGDGPRAGIFAFDGDDVAFEDLDALAFFALGVVFFDLLVDADDHTRLELFDLLYFDNFDRFFRGLGVFGSLDCRGFGRLGGFDLGFSCFRLFGHTFFRFLAKKETTSSRLRSSV